jgi:hypothetical protein
MRGWRRGLAAGLGLAAAGCAHPGPVGQPTPGVTEREDLTRRFVIFIGQKAQHAPPFLGIPGTNFYCLRALLDRKTGEVSYQVYVQESYFGGERAWETARDAAGAPLRFAHISTDEITCEERCSYAEEFAAAIPEAELRANPRGLAVTFAAHAGETKTVEISGAQIAAQLAAVAAGQRERRAAAPGRTQ